MVDPSLTGLEDESYCELLQPAELPMTQPPSGVRPEQRAAALNRHGFSKASICRWKNLLFPRLILWKCSQQPKSQRGGGREALEQLNTMLTFCQQ